MASHGNRETSLLVRGAVAVGRTLGQWRQRRVAAAQDAYVTLWKAAWTEGCSAAWAHEPLSSLPYHNGPLRDAWAAGWNWAQTQPDRRHPADPRASTALVRPPRVERRHLVNAAKGGALSLTLIAAARWLLRARPTAPRPRRSN